MRRLSIRFRLLLAGGLGLALALLLAAWGLALLFDRHMERAAAIALDARLDYITAALEVGPDRRITMPDPPREPLYQRPYSGHYWQVEAAGKDLRSRSLWDFALDLPEVTEKSWQGTLTGPTGAPLLALMRQVDLRSADSVVPLRIAVALNRSEIDTARTGFLTDLAPYLAVLAVALLATLGTAITVALRPLSTIGRKVAALNDGSARRVGADVPGEVLPLAAEIDALLDKREAELERARLRAGDLAHSLKTPLQALLGEAVRLRTLGNEEAARGVEEIARSMRGHVDRELARAQRAAGPAGSSDPLEVANSVASVLRRTPEGARIRIDVEGLPGLAVRLHRSDLTEAIGALAENAVRYAAGNVVLACARTGDNVTIRVHDDGAGTTEDLLDRLTERGLRLDERSDGTGLGLAIVAAIAESAAGTLDLRNLDPGFEAELVLPAFPASATQTGANQ